VDCGVDAVGFEARGHGEHADEEAPATVLNSLMDITRAGGALGIPGLYVTGDPGAKDEAAKHGSLSIRIGLGWAKSHSFATGQCPVMKYHRELMMAILEDRAHIANAVNATVIALDDAPSGYENFDKGAAVKYVLDPHGLVKTGGALRLERGDLVANRVDALHHGLQARVAPAERPGAPHGERVLHRVHQPVVLRA
jgi:glutathione-independent formaldehyde dehydrogenase